MGGGWEVLEAGGLYSEEQTGCRNTAPEAGSRQGAVFLHPAPYSEEQTGCRNTAPEARVDARVANERK